MMNDFTKEELWYMADGLFFINKQCDMPDEIKIKLSSLLQRIESMIDNYCEHDWHKGVHLFNDIYCTKCSKSFKVNNDN